MKHAYIPIALVVVLIALSGCQSFSGEFAFRNHSTRQVWVDRVEGFKYPPPVGVLIPNATAMSFMGPMDLPSEILLRWSYEWDKDDKRSVLSLRDNPPPSRNAELEIIFTPEEVWIAHWLVRKPL